MFQINEELRRLSTHSMVTMFSVGKSYEGKDQYAVEVRNKRLTPRSHDPGTRIEP